MWYIIGLFLVFCYFAYSDGPKTFGEISEFVSNRKEAIDKGKDIFYATGEWHYVKTGEIVYFKNVKGECIYVTKGDRREILNYHKTKRDKENAKAREEARRNNFDTYEYKVNGFVTYEMAKNFFWKRRICKYNETRSQYDYEEKIILRETKTNDAFCYLPCLVYKTRTKRNTEGYDGPDYLEIHQMRFYKIYYKNGETWADMEMLTKEELINDPKRVIFEVPINEFVNNGGLGINVFNNKRIILHYLTSESGIAVDSFFKFLKERDILHMVKATLDDPSKYGPLDEKTEQHYRELLSKGIIAYVDTEKLSRYYATDFNQENWLGIDANMSDWNII